jgi:hypothetical protein
MDSSSLPTLDAGRNLTELFDDNIVAKILRVAERVLAIGVRVVLLQGKLVCNYLT